MKKILLLLAVYIILDLGSSYRVIPKGHDPCPVGTIEFISDGFYADGSFLCFPESVDYPHAVESSNDTICWKSNGAVLSSLSPECIQNCTNSSICSGDVKYCSTRSCDPNSKCWCREGAVTNLMIAKCDFGPVTATNKTSVLACLDLAAESLPASNIDYSNPNTWLAVEHLASKVILKITKALGKFVKVVKLKRSSLLDRFSIEELFPELHDGGNKRSIYQESEVLVDVSDEEIYLETENDMILVYQRRHMTSLDVEDDACSLGDCRHCHGMVYGSCVINSFGMIIVTIAIVTFFLAVWLTVWVVCCTMACRKDCRIPCCCCTIDCSRFRKQAAHNEIEMETNNSNNQSMAPTFIINTPTAQPIVHSQVPVGVPVHAPIANPMHLLVISLFVLGSLITPTFAQCTTNVISNSNIKVCTRHNETANVCTFRPTFTVSVGGIGNQACIGFTVNGSIPAGEMTIKVINFQAIQTLNKAYYTTAWSGVAEAANVCYGGPFTTACCDEKSYLSCSDYYNKGAISNPCSYFSAGALNLPGVTGCVSYPGGWNTNCFYYVDMCQYWRGSIAPRGRVIEVNSPSLVTYEVTLDITMKTSDSTTTKRLTSSVPTINSPDQGFSGILNGFFVDFGINWGAKKIGVVGSEVRLIDAADPNLPTVGSIGDIQSSYVSGLTSPNPGSFVFANNIMGATPQSTGPSITFQGSGGDMWSHFPQAPFTYTGFTWSWSNGLRATVSRQLNSLVTITMLKDINVYFQNDLICPVSAFVASAGCFNCPFAAELNFTIRSTCRPGSCTLSLSNGTLFNTSIYMDTTEKQSTVLYATRDQFFEDTLVITCPERTSSFKFSATLIDWQSIHNRSDSDVQTPPSSVDAPIGLDIGGLFGLSKVAESFIMIAIIVSAILLVAVVAFLIIKCIMHKKGVPSDYKSVLKVMVGREHIPSSYSKLEESKLLGQDLID